MTREEAIDKIHADLMGEICRYENFLVETTVEHIKQNWSDKEINSWFGNDVIEGP